MALFSELQSSLSVSVSDFSRGLNRAGSRARGFGRTVSRSMERAGDEMGQLSVRSQMAAEGIDDISGNMGRASVNAGLLSGRLETLSDRITGAGARAMAAAPAFSSLAISAGSAELAISGLSMVTTASLIPAMALLVTALAPVAAVLGTIAAGAAALGGMFALIIGSGAIAAQQTGALSKALKQTRKEILSLITQFGKQFIPLLRDAIVALPKLVKSMLAAVGGTDQFVRMLRRLGKIAMQVLPQLIGFMFRLAEQALPILQDLISYLQQNGPSAFNRIRKSVIKLWPKFVKLMNAIIPLLPPLYDIGVTVVSVLLPALTKLINAITPLVKWFNQLAPPIKRAVIALSAIIGVLTPIIAAIGKFVVTIGPLLIRFARFIGLASRVASAIALLSNPITLIIGLIALLATAWITDWMGIRTKTMKLLGQIASFIRKKWRQIKNWTEKQLTRVRRIARNVWQGIKNTISRAIQKTQKTAQRGWNFIRNTTANVLKRIQTIARNVWQGIKNTISRALQSIRTIAGNIWQGIENAIRGAMGRIQTAARNIWQGIKGTISRTIRSIHSTISSVLGRIVTAVTTWDLAGAIRGVVDSGLRAVQNFAGDMYQAGQNIVDEIVNGIKAAPGAVKNAVGDVVGEARRFLPWSPAKEGPLSDLDKTGPALVRTFASGIESEAGRARNAAQTAAYAARDPLIPDSNRRQNNRSNGSDTQAIARALLQVLGGTQLELDVADEDLVNSAQLKVREGNKRWATRNTGTLYTQ